MSEPVIAAAVPEKPLSPSELFLKTKADKADPAKAAADAAAAAALVVPKRASGDERKFRSALSRRDREIGELRAKIDALTPKQAAAAATQVAASDAPPKREDCASDEEFAEKRTAYTVKKEIEKQKVSDAQSKEIRETLEAYNAKIEAAPAKYPDWDEVLKAGNGGALSVDLGKECPSLLWAIAKSPYADDCFYNWLKDASKLQSLIDTYKSGPQGEIEAIAAFHRFEGRVGKDAPEKKAEVKDTKKADDAARVPKPKPSAEAQVRGGTPAPDGAPEIYLPGTHTINPAWKTWRRNQGAR